MYSPISGHFDRVKILNYRELKAEELEEDGDDDDEDESFELGVNAVPSSKGRKREVDIRSRSLPNQTIKLRTNLFAWTYSWLDIEIMITGWGGQKFLANNIQNNRFVPTRYFLDDQDDINVIIQFLTSIKPMKRQDQPDHTESFQDFINQFLKFLRSNFRRDLKIANFYDLLEAFKNHEGQESPSYAAAQQIEAQAWKSEAGFALLLATTAPNIFRVGPLLFPRKIRSLMPREDDDDDERRTKLLFFEQVLDKLVVNNPWSLGFSTLVYEATKGCPIRYSGLEASLLCMKRAEFYNGLTDLEKDSLHMYDLIKKICANDGHTFVYLSDIKRNHGWMRKHNRHQELNHSFTDYDSALEILVEKKVLHCDQKPGCDKRYHLMRYWKAEESIREHLDKVFDKHEQRDGRLEVDFSKPGFDRIRTDQKQLEAAQRICDNPLTIISGRGGTGKTEIVTAVLNEADEILIEKYKDPVSAFNDSDDELFQSIDTTTTSSGRGSHGSHGTTPGGSRRRSVTKQQGVVESPSKVSLSGGGQTNGNILYVAPTGKAAAVMRKRSKQNAYTIHQVIFSFRNWTNKDSDKGPWKFSDTQIVAVDEVSMVSLELFSHLLSCLEKNSKLMKIVLLGDKLQLPSIEPGNFMEDMFHAHQGRGWTIELLTNHRSEGSLIFSNAKLISEQRAPVFNSNGFELLVPSSDNEDTLAPMISGPGVITLPKVKHKTTRMLIEKSDKIKKDHCPTTEGQKETYLSLISNYRTQFGIEDDRNSQFIAFKRSECTIVNDICCYTYNKHHVMEAKDGTTKKVILIVKGDKIMCTKNADVPTYFEEEEEKENDCDHEVNVDGSKKKKSMVQKPIRYMNGNVYKVEAIVTEEKVEMKTENEDGHQAEESKQTGGVSYFVLDDLANETAKPNQKLFRKNTKPQHAWALTIHKFQGSETDNVIYGVSSSAYENWKHVYTAVTRGKKRVVIVGRYEDLIKAIKRKPRPRQTTLQEKMMTRSLQGEEKKACSRRLGKRSGTPRIEDDSFDVQLSQAADADLDALEITPKKSKEDLFEDDDEVFTSVVSPQLSKSLSSQLRFEDEFGATQPYQPVVINEEDKW